MSAARNTAAESGVMTPDSPAFRAIFPYQSRFFQVGGHRLHYIDEGRGPVVLMMHACPMWIFSFRDLIAELAKDHRVIAIDQMGFGLSDKPENFDYRIETHVDHIDRFTRELGLKDISLVLHGRGAAIGMAFAVRNPENVRGFVTLNAMSFSDYSLPLRLLLCRIKWAGAKLVMHLDIFQRDLYRLPPDIRNAYLMPFPDTKSKIAFFRFIEDIPCAPEDASAQTMFEIESALWLLRDKPVCIIWAKKDWLYRTRNLKKWIQYFPKAELHILDRAGRCITEDAPEELAFFVRDFFTRNHL